jgi:hypothetical protein
LREPTFGSAPDELIRGAAGPAPKLCAETLVRGVPSTRYPIVIKLALPPAAAVLMLIERSVNNHSSE